MPSAKAKPETRTLASVPPVGATWANQVAGNDDDDDDDGVITAADSSAIARLETVTAPDQTEDEVEGEIDRLLYTRDGDEDEPQPVETFDPLTLICQLQDFGCNAKQNGITYWLRFGTGETVSNRVVKAKGADLTFEKVLIGKGASVSLVSSTLDPDGNPVTKIKVLLPESEMMRADPRLLLGHKATMTLEPAQMEFDLTTRAE